MKLESAIKEQGISLRQVCLNLDINYNMVLKASKKPIVGVAYDPTFINYAEVEEYLKKHCNYDDIDWSTMKASSEVSNEKLPSEFTVGTLLSLRGDSEVYEVKLVTPTHICILPILGTQPRVLSIPTFLHQGPKVTK